MYRKYPFLMWLAIEFLWAHIRIINKHFYFTYILSALQVIIGNCTICFDKHLKLIVVHKCSFRSLNKNKIRFIWFFNPIYLLMQTIVSCLFPRNKIIAEAVTVVTAEFPKGEKMLRNFKHWELKAIQECWVSVEQRKIIINPFRLPFNFV